LASPTQRTWLDEWSPDAKINGDVLAVELSFSPEGHWMAVAHLAIGLDDRERTIEISAVSIRELPACR
jgi:hypothetical protein